MSTDTHAEAIKTFLATATNAPVLDFDEAQALANSALPPAFTIIHIARRYGGEARLDGTRPTTLRRLNTRVAARTVTNARLIEDRIAAAFEFATVDLGDTFTHFAFETGGGVFELTEGFYVNTSAWTFPV